MTITSGILLRISIMSSVYCGFATINGMIQDGEGFGLAMLSGILSIWAAGLASIIEWNKS